MGSSCTWCGAFTALTSSGPMFSCRCRIDEVSGEEEEMKREREREREINTQRRERANVRATRREEERQTKSSTYASRDPHKRKGSVMCRVVLFLSIPRFLPPHQTTHPPTSSSSSKYKHGLF